MIVYIVYTGDRGHASVTIRPVEPVESLIDRHYTIAGRRSLLRMPMGNLLSIMTGVNLQPLKQRNIKRFGMPAVEVYSGTERVTRRLWVIAARELSVAHASHEPWHTKFKFIDRKEQLSFKLHTLTRLQL